MTEIYNQLEQYFIDQSLQNKLSDEIIANLSYNPSISIDVLIKICTNCNENYKNYIIYNPNLTIDHIEQYLSNYIDNTQYKYTITTTIGQYYDIFHDKRITFSNGHFYYKNIILTNVVNNKHLTYEIFKSYKYIKNISHNRYICLNPNGNIIYYDMNNFNADDIADYTGIYDNIEEFIIKHKMVLMNKIDNAQSYLSYDFIQNNLDLFTIKYNYAIGVNKSLTINNILNIIENNLEIDHVMLFANANITLDEIITNNLHNNEYFHYYAQNRNCTVNDILCINWNYKKLNEHLSLNCHDYNNNEYVFKFAD
jgi:hypothetical protein